MKTVVFSFILFFATLAAAISNSIYIHKTSALLCDAVDALPSVGDSECDLLLAKNLNIPAYGVRRRIDYDKCVCLDSLMDFEKAFSENRTE